MVFEVMVSYHLYLYHVEGCIRYYVSNDVEDYILYDEARILNEDEAYGHDVEQIYILQVLHDGKDVDTNNRAIYKDSNTNLGTNNNLLLHHNNKVCRM